MSNGQQPPVDQTTTTPMPQATAPVFTFGPNFKLVKFNGIKAPREGAPPTEDSLLLQQALTGKEILVGVEALRARGVRGRAASTSPNVFYGRGLMDENGFLVRPFYQEEDTSDAKKVLINMTPDQRKRWAAEAKRVGIYVNTDPSTVILANGESYNSTDENAMRLFLIQANQNNLTATAMLDKLANYATVSEGTGRAAPMVSSPEDIGYYLNQASLSMTGKPMTKALAKQLIEQYQQMERQAATSRVSAPSTALFAQSAVAKAQPEQVAGNAVGKAIQLAFRALTGR